MAGVIRVGTRGSKLALRQTHEVIRQLLAAHPDVEFQVVTITTSGDIRADAPIPSLGVGAFIKEIERSLLEGSVDLAVHSLKDLPTRMNEGLTLGAVLLRGDPRDVLVNKWDCTLAQLPEGARIGTSSPRREAQVKYLRPDVQVVPIRGNVETRLGKSVGADYDGVVLAAAGLDRLEMADRVSEYLDPKEFVPAPGQGALAVEVRSDDSKVMEMVSHIDHRVTRREVTCERAFLEELGSGCSLPAGAYATSDDEQMELTVFLAPSDVGSSVRVTVQGDASQPEKLAQDAYRKLGVLNTGAESGHAR